MEKEADLVVTRGPNRVMIGPHEATSVIKANMEHGIVIDIMFLRDDGWILGAPASLENDAYKTWSDKWTHFVRKPDMLWTSIDKYHTKNA